MTSPDLTAAGDPPKLTYDELAAAQEATMASPRRHPGLAARTLFGLLDAVYGRPRTLSKFKVLELVARVPYQAWEQVAYVAITHVHERTGLARRIHERVAESRAQQDNEQWHPLLLEELIAAEGIHESRFRFYWIPQALAFVDYQLSWLLFVLHPAWSYRLNADFEDHAEHEYMVLVAENPSWEGLPFPSAVGQAYGQFQSRADLFRQIGHDERVHKQESVHQMAQPRFRRAPMSPLPIETLSQALPAADPGSVRTVVSDRRQMDKRYRQGTEGSRASGARRSW